MNSPYFEAVVRDRRPPDRRDDSYKSAVWFCFYFFFSIKAWQGLHIETHTQNHAPFMPALCCVLLTPGLCLKAHPAYYSRLYSQLRTVSTRKSRCCKVEVTFTVCSRKNTKKNLVNEASTHVLFLVGSMHHKHVRTDPWTHSAIWCGMVAVFFLTSFLCLWFHRVT